MRVLLAVEREMLSGTIRELLAPGMILDPHHSPGPGVGLVPLARQAYDFKPQPPDGVPIDDWQPG